MELSLPWTPGAATGVGSMPGTDIIEAVKTVFGELPDLPYLPELPARGPGADLIGRGATFLTDLPVDLQPSGWRFVDRPGRDLRRAQDFLERDLDTLTEYAGEYDGVLKVQACGPWTLAATLELHYGDKALADHGAVRDLAGSLADGLARHVADVRRRLPHATVLVQLDEPSLPAVLAGRVRTASGFGTLRRPEASTVETLLGQVIGVLGRAEAPVLVHCCAPDVPWALFHGAGAVAVSADLTGLFGGATPARAVDALGEQLDAGLGLVAGVVPALDPAPTAGAPGGPAGRTTPARHDGSGRRDGREVSDPTASVTGVRTLWRRLGFAPDQLPAQVVTSPTCGLAGASATWARAALARCREAGRRLLDDPEA